MKTNITNIVNKEKFKLSLMFFMYFFFSCFFFNIFKFLKILNCLVLTEILAIIIPILIYFMISLKKDFRKKIFTIFIYLFITLMLPFVFTKIYDTTCDGNSYHKTSIGLIKEGWNPIYESSSDFNSQLFGKVKNNIWIDHYPKASYFISSSIYSLTNNIESGKCITLIANISLILLFISLFEDKYNKKFIYFLALLLGLNPIVLSQIFNYYIDGLMGICFGIELMLLSIIDPKDKKFNSIWFYLLCCCSVFVNLKFTGLLYSGLIAAVYYFYWIIKNRKCNEKWKIIRNFTYKFIIIYVIAIGFIGFSSYIKNFIDHKNPLYPIIGKDKVDIVTTMQPSNYENKNSFYKFVNSFFSKTENVTYGMETSLKNPFSVTKQELDVLYLPDTRIGGFGPLFAATIIILLISIILNIKQLIRTKENIGIILSIISILLSIILVGEGWWARYIPQLYYIIIIGLIMLYNMSKEGNKLNKLFIVVISLLCLTNSSLFIYSKKVSFDEFRDINYQLDKMKYKDNIIALGAEDFYGVLYNLKDKNINFNLDNSLSLDETDYYFAGRIRVKK